MRAFIHYSVPLAQKSAALSQRLGGGHVRPREISAPLVGRITNLDCDEANSCKYVLERYLTGWSEADLDKIVVATAPNYYFDDPLVGRFYRKSLPAYFEHLKERFARVGAYRPREYAFFFWGPMDAPKQGQWDYFREAPALGLTGVSRITIGEHGVVAERVAYDLNLASDVLRSTP
jgi:hypothetical protein